MQTVKISALAFGFALVTAACGDKMSSLNPTAPSALSPDSVSVEANAADVEAGSMGNGPKPGNGNGNGNGSGNDSGNGNGNGNGNGSGSGNGGGNGNGNDNRTPANTSPTPAVPVPPGKSTVQFEGLVDTVGAASLTVSGQVVKVTGSTVIRHGNVPFQLSGIHRFDRVHVRATRVAAPAGGVGLSALATLEAVEIKVQNPGDGDAEPEAPVAAVVENPLVSVSAVDDSAVEQGANPGTFRLTRTGSAAQLAAPLSVSLALSGTATAADYAAVPLTANFLANQASVDVTLMPMNDGLTESPESVVLTLNPATGYDLGSPATASVMIADAPPPVVSLTAPDGNAGEIANTGRFELTRTGDLSVPLTVIVEISGTATNGVDYPSLEATYTFVPGQEMIRVFVEPYTDTVVELAAETIVITLIDGADYDLGLEMTGVITIAAR